MFRSVEKQIVEWPVRVRKPEDGGTIKVHETQARFEVLPQAEHDAIYDAGGKDFEMIVRVVTGWDQKDWQSKDGQEIPFSPEALRVLLDDVHVRAGFTLAVLEIRNGREAARKNS